MESSSVALLLTITTVSKSYRTMELNELIAKIKNTRDYENLKQRLGKKLGTLLYQLVDEADKADKELDIIHECITELYNIELNVPRIKKALDKIEASVG